MKMDILSALEHKFSSFSKGQRTIAQFILKNYDKAAFMTAARLGEVTGVSESTVVRFAADLGYRGYPGMKKALQEIVRNRLTSVERIEAAESTMDGHDVLKAVLRADINNLQATLDEVDQDNFDQAVDMILSAKHIYIIGMRTSTTLADFLGIYLKLLLDNVTVVKEIAAREVYEQMLRIGEGDLIIGISYPRYSKRTISAMKFARDHGARCLGITAQQRLGQNARHGGLARAARSAEQVRVGQASLGDGVLERRDDMLLAHHGVEGERAILSVQRFHGCSPGYTESCCRDGHAVARHTAFIITRTASPPR